MKGLKLLSVVLLVLTASAGAVLLFLPGDDLYEVDLLLAKADKAIEGESWKAAADYIRQTFPKGRGEAVWLRIVKRALISAQNRGDYGIFYDATHRAVEQLPGNEKLWALAVASSLRTGRELQAREEARENLRSPDYELLKAEAVLSAEIVEKEGLDGEVTPLEFLEQKLAEGQDPRLFERVADALGKPRLNQDAAYLWMERGNPQQAYSNMLHVPAGVRDRVAAAMIALDAGKETYARQELEAAVEDSRREGAPRWDLMTILADIRRRQEEWPEAAALYREVIAAVPDLSWKTYRSLASLYRDTGDIAKIVPLLRQGIEAFKEKKRWEEARPLYLSLAAYNIDRGRRDRARKDLEEYLTFNPDDPEAHLFLFDLLNKDQLSAEKREARLWNLFNQHPENRSLAQYILWYLLGKGDYPGAFLVLDRHRAAEEEELDWEGYYRAVIHTLQGKYETALEEFSRDYEQTGRWASPYNMAVIHDYLDQDSRAETFLETAEERLMVEQPDTRARSRWLGRIRTRQGKLLLGRNREEEAREKLEQALELNPDSRRAKSYLRIIE